MDCTVQPCNVDRVCAAGMSIRELFIGWADTVHFYRSGNVGCNDFYYEKTIQSQLSSCLAGCKLLSGIFQGGYLLLLCG